MTDTADMLLTLAASIEARGGANINEVFTLNQAQRDWIVQSLRHKATSMRMAVDERFAKHIEQAFDA